MSLVNRFYSWWLDGYPPEVKARILYEKKHPKPKKSLRQRFYEWWLSGFDSEEETKYLDFTLEHEEKALEHRNVNEKARVLTLEQPSQSLVLTSEEPSKEDLDALKSVSNIEKGSLQYKKRGDGVYLVTYSGETKGRDWTLIGTWGELKSRIA